MIQVLVCNLSYLFVTSQSSKDLDDNHTCSFSQVARMGFCFNTRALFVCLFKD